MILALLPLLFVSHSYAAIPASAATPALTVPCKKDLNFDQWLNGVIREATASGISNDAIQAALPEMTLSQSVLSADRSQSVFQQSFLQFSDRMATDSRIQRASRMLKSNQALFARIEKDFGVPAPVLLAFWGLESDFGADMGRSPIITAVTTLAYDCRRAPFFRTQLFDALRVVQRGDQQPGQMNGDWAGELGGLQITPSDYFNYAVDYDGDGRRDLVHSVPDTLASGANFLMHLGWQRGQPWLQEVRVPIEMPWQEADMNIEHTRSQWARWGVTAANGPLANDNMNASLLLPMGRLGPAFLVYSNFKTAYLGWNSAMVYSTTAAYLATRIAGAQAVGRGNGTVTLLTPPQMTELQRGLVKAGFDVGVIDGKLGASMRVAVKKAQLKFGLPADSYPSLELLDRVR